MKNLLSIFALIFILSCDDVITQSESNKYGAIKLIFNKPSEELTEDINSRSMSQFVDVDAVRITINNSAPATVSIVGGSASYSKSGLPVGTATVKVELTGAGITKYTQTKSVSIIADQQTSASFNAFAITNQSVSYTSTFESTYDVGNDINLSWTNSHAEQPVNIERWDQVGGVWIKSSTIESNFVGTSYTWNTQGESSGESIKVRIQSTISSSFIDSQPFQLLATEAIILYNPTGGTTAFYDVDVVGSTIVAAGSYKSNNQPLLVSYDISGNLQNAITTSSISADYGYTHVLIKNGYIFAVATNTSNGRIYLDKYDSSLNFLERNTWSNSGSSPLAFGLEAYEYNGSTHLVIPIAYDDTAYEYNASMLSFDISGSSIVYVSNWGWHTTTDDQFAIDVNTKDGDIILTKIYDYTNNPYFYYQRWKNFSPTSGSSNTLNSQVDITSIKADLDLIESLNHSFFNSIAYDGAFNASTLNNWMTTSFVYSFQYGSSLISSQNDEYFASSIFLNNSDFTQVLLGDGYTGSNYSPAIHHYIGSSFQNKRIFTEFNNEGYFVRGKKITNDSYVAVGISGDDAILYISNTSNKTSGLIEFSDSVIDQFPQMEQISTGKFVNAK